MSQKKPPRVVSSTSELTGDEVVRNVPGNTFDKHGSTSPIVSRLMARFHEAVISEVASFEPDRVLDVGCGEGRTTGIVSQAIPARFVGIDLEEVVILEARQTVREVEFCTGSVLDLPFSDESFDVVMATEMLEHVDRPLDALAEMSRVASKGVVVTVPHEPWWRIANVMRGRYITSLGNTPGHVQHWSIRSLRETLRSQSESVSVSPVGLWLLGTISR